MGSIKSYNHLARIIIRASALESGPWFEYSQGERLRRAHGGGHSLERTVCAVHGELFETWLQNTLPCAGTKAGMETNINYNPLETDPSSDEDDIVYDDSGNPTPTRPAWKDLYDASGPDYKKDWTGEPVGYAYYKTLVNIVQKVAVKYRDKGWDTPIEEIYGQLDSLLEDSDSSIMPSLMNGTKPVLNFFKEFLKEVEEGTSSPERQNEVFKKLRT